MRRYIYLIFHLCSGLDKMFGAQKNVEKKEIQPEFPIGSFIGIFIQKAEEHIFTFVRLIKNCTDSCETIYFYESIIPKEFVSMLKQYGVLTNKQIYFKPVSDLFSELVVSPESLITFRQILRQLTKDSREQRPNKLALRVIMDTRWLCDLYAKNPNEFDRFISKVKDIVESANAILLFVVDMKKQPGSFVYELMQRCQYHIISGKLFEYA